MTTGWLLLLLLIVSSQSVDSQSTTDDESCGEAGLLSKLQSGMERLLDNQQQLLQRICKYANFCGKLGVIESFTSAQILRLIAYLIKQKAV